MTDVKKNRVLAVLTPLLFMLGIGGGFILGRLTGHVAGGSDTRSKYDMILDMIGREYVDTVNVDSLLELSIPDLLSYLDPHSTYIPVSDFEAVNDELEGSFSGVGISFQINADSVVVVEVIPGGPAEKVGLMAGDRILRADTASLVGNQVSNEKVFNNLRGKKGSKVALKVKRPGVAGVLDYTVVRDDVPTNSVDAAYLIDKNIGYIRVSKFARTTFSEFLTALTDLQKQGAGKMIVDLRGNSGGYMDQAIMMANEFLPAGRKIVYTKGRNTAADVEAFSDGSGKSLSTELVVLMDEFSASASEIFAGAIQDNDRGLVIGRRSFGKGLVQNQLMLPDNSALRLTVARYYTPSGRSIQKEYQPGANGKYDLDIVNRFNKGEFYSLDSIRLDKTKVYHTAGGRTVYGGGGIMPDIFVPQDTTGYTSYYMSVINNGLIPKYAMQVADSYRPLMRGKTELKDMYTVIPRDETLLNNFVDYAVTQGLPARWYYINQSRDALLLQLKAVMARDLLGYQQFWMVLNGKDPVINRAIKELNAGNSPVVIKK